jgi:hypothetical protein
MNSFEPLGDRSRREILTEFFGGIEYGATVEYDRLAGMLGVDPTDRATVRGAINQSKRSIEKVHKRVLRAVRGVGYRVVDPAQHVEVAQAHHRKSVRAIRRGRSVVDNVDLARLTEDQRRLALATGAILGWQLQQIRRLEVRQAQTEKVLEGVTVRLEETTETTGARLAELEARLKRMEAEQG